MTLGQFKSNTTSWIQRVLTACIRVSIDLCSSVAWVVCVNNFFCVTLWSFFTLFNSNFTYKLMNHVAYASHNILTFSNLIQGCDYVSRTNLRKDITSGNNKWEILHLSMHHIEPNSMRFSILFWPHSQQTLTLGISFQSRTHGIELKRWKCTPFISLWHIFFLLQRSKPQWQTKYDVF